MVKMWYFTFTHNCDNVLKINHLTRTRIIASLPGLVFRRRRAVFMFLFLCHPVFIHGTVVCSMKKKHPHRWGCGCFVLLSVWGAIIRLCRRYRALLWSCGCRVLPSSRVLDHSICVGRILLAFQWTPCEQQRWMPNESRYRCWFCKQHS